MGKQEKQIFTKQGESGEMGSFDKLFPIGEPVQLLHEKIKGFSILRGVKSQSFVFIDPPMMKNKPVLFPPDANLSVSFLSEGKVYSFKTFIVKEHRGLRLTELEYPEVINEITLRDSERVSVVIPLMVTTSYGSSSSAATILNFSREGAMLGIEHLDGLELATKVTLSFEIPGNNSSTIIGAEIKNMKQYEGKVVVGVAFDSNDKFSKLAVSSFYDDCSGYI